MADVQRKSSTNLRALFVAEFTAEYLSAQPADTVEHMFSAFCRGIAVASALAPAHQHEPVELVPNTTQADIDRISVKALWNRWVGGRSIAAIRAEEAFAAARAIPARSALQALEHNQEVLVTALQRIALRIIGDIPGQVLAREALSNLNTALVPVPPVDDEKLQFEHHYRNECGMPDSASFQWDAPYMAAALDGWMARAAIAKCEQCLNLSLIGKSRTLCEDLIHAEGTSAPAMARELLPAISYLMVSVARVVYRQADLERDAARWAAVEKAGGETTLRIHNTQPGLRAAVIDAVPKHVEASHG